MTPTPPRPTSTPITHPAHTLLTHAHAPDVATQIFTNKIKNRPLLLTPSTDTRTHRRALRAKKQKYHIQHSKPRPLSAKEKRILRIYDLSNPVYETYVGLNVLWKGYILEVLGFTRDGKILEDTGKRVVTQDSHGSLIASADFHGMEVEVVRCKDVGRVGVRGIVVRETRGCLVLVLRGNKQTRVLKREAVFRVEVEVPNGSDSNPGAREAEEKEEKEQEKKRKVVFELHGGQLEVRPVDRATRKCKWHPEPCR